MAIFAKGSESTGVGDQLLGVQQALCHRVRCHWSPANDSPVCPQSSKVCSTSFQVNNRCQLSSNMSRIAALSSFSPCYNASIWKPRSKREVVRSDPSRAASTKRLSALSCSTMIVKCLFGLFGLESKMVWKIRPIIIDHPGLAPRICSTSTNWSRTRLLLPPQASLPQVSTEPSPSPIGESLGCEMQKMESNLRRNGVKVLKAFSQNLQTPPADWTKEILPWSQGFGARDQLSSSAHSSQNVHRPSDWSLQCSRDRTKSDQKQSARTWKAPRRTSAKRKHPVAVVFSCRKQHTVSIHKYIGNDDELHDGAAA